VEGKSATIISTLHKPSASIAATSDQILTSLLLLIIFSQASIHPQAASKTFSYNVI
jgi:hypothetical protein